MKLRELTIKRYRSIEDLHISFLDAKGTVRPVTVLAGPNGCGKTTVLFGIVQTLRGIMGYKTDDVPDPTELDIRRFGPSMVFTTTPPQVEVSLEVEFAPDELKAIEEVAVQTRELHQDTALTRFTEECVTVEWVYPPGLNRDGTARPTWHVRQVSPWQALPWFKGRLWAIQGNRKGLLKDTKLIDRIGGPMMFPQDRSLKARVTGTESGTTDPDKSASIFDRLSVAEILKDLGQRATAPPLPTEGAAKNGMEDLQKQAVVAENRIKSLFKQICGPREYLGFGYTPAVPFGAPFFKDGNSEYPLHQAASGEQVILEYITRLAFPNPLNRGLVLVDEPEVHLHPGWIRQLYRAFPQFGIDNQYILTTHSQDLRALAASDGVLVDMGEF